MAPILLFHSSAKGTFPADAGAKGTAEIMLFGRTDLSQREMASVLKKVSQTSKDKPVFHPNCVR